VIGERTPEGWTARLRPRGAGRFLPAGFLLFWLCGWAAGELFAIRILALGARSLLEGQPSGSGSTALDPVPTLAAGAFLCFWLALWTFGGLAAIHALLRLVWSEDRVTAGPDGLTLVRRIGPLSLARRVPREKMTRVYRPAATGPVMVETIAGPLEITRMGSPGERAELEERLERELSLAPEETPGIVNESLPREWEEILDPEGANVLTPSLAMRRRKAVAVWCIALSLSAGAAALLLCSIEWPRWGALAAVTTASALFSLWGAARLSWRRVEWRVESGRLTMRRRFGSRVTDEFVAAALELTRIDDHDGDTRFELAALAEPPAADGACSPGSRRPIASSIHDPSTPRRVGRWLAARSGLPLRDLATEEARAGATARLLEALPQAGPIGRWLFRRLR
jgi:hypothetical protein